MRLWICAAAANGFVAVAVASFAAHSLGEDVAPKILSWIETGVRYELVHALALLGVAILSGRAEAPRRTLGVAGWGFLLGTVLFSGGLYLMAWTGWRALAAAVPVGGVGFLAGWAALFAYGLDLRRGPAGTTST